MRKRHHKASGGGCVHHAFVQATGRGLFQIPLNRKRERFLIKEKERMADDEVGCLYPADGVDWLNCPVCCRLWRQLSLAPVEIFSLTLAVRERVGFPSNPG